MIAKPYIAAWQAAAPWKEFFQVEQDLVLSRVIVEIFSDNYLNQHLAFRGGTALHKLFLSPAARYSEDIDLVQIIPGGIKPILQRLEEVITFFPAPRATKVSGHGAKIFYKFSSEYEGIPLRLKIEMNCQEHFHVLPWNFVRFTVDNPWFSKTAQVRTYDIHELLGTKFRALYQRKKGRDLFDLAHTLERMDVDVEKVLYCYRHYVNQSGSRSPGKTELLQNLALKEKDLGFLMDMESLLSPDMHYDAQAAFHWLRGIVEKHY